VTPAQPGISHEYLVRVGYADVDKMGFVHHSRYLVYLESARTELLRTTGISYREWEERGILLPLTECSLQYRQPGRYDDELSVKTEIIECTRLRISFQYRVEALASRTLIATGITRHVFMSPEGRPIRASAELLAMLAPYLPPEKG
jgi:acyl-CoA thioester hydrolase